MTEYTEAAAEWLYCARSEPLRSHSIHIWMASIDRSSDPPIDRPCPTPRGSS